jgi:hypothetical protein
MRNYRCFNKYRHSLTRIQTPITTISKEDLYYKKTAMSLKPIAVFLCGNNYLGVAVQHYRHYQHQYIFVLIAALWQQ